ncbi:hypothetical protein L1049_023156 [Liquidambar formosana]|uniref:DUF4042 domain-containing protein n=1 Tax=Liquidambar formosana TaxID=63359 RepID=A0AAP0RF58_LIQFO
MFMLELAATAAKGDEDKTHTFTHIFRLIHGLSQCVSLDINSSSWSLMLDSFGNMVEFFLGKPGTKRVFSGNAAGIRAILDCLETLRCLISVYHRKCLLSENIQLVKFLLRIVECSHAELLCSSYSNGNQRCGPEVGKRIPRSSTLWEVLTITFTMIGEVFSRLGSSFPVDIWQSTIGVLRKVMDVLASKSLLVEDNVMSRFYTSLLNCLHLVLMDPKGSLSDHVAGFVAALRMFFIYGLSNKPQYACPVAGNKDKELSSMSLKSGLAESTKNGGLYRPPHLRKKDGTNLQQPKASDSQSFSDHESCTIVFTSSDSDYSDSDGSVKDVNSVHSSKARVAAIVCIQDLCQADPKSFTGQWTMLLPTNEVLQLRKYEATLMTCLLFDPYLKARIASASTLAAMMDGPASVFLQVAEYKESTKRGSFTALSSSLGQILMQLHTGILYLIQRETHSGLLASLFKNIMLLISSTPYSRMPAELLPTVLTTLRAWIEEGFPFKSDQTGLLVAAFNCLTAALSSSPVSPQVKEMFLEELSTGFAEVQGKRGVLRTIFSYSERVTSPAVSFEALQALRAVSHNYPNIMGSCWGQVSNIVYGFLRLATPEVSTRSWKGHDGIGLFGEKVITAAIKVLDECLRAISGFKGTEDLLDDRLLDTPFTSDCVRIKKISSAPSYGLESLGGFKDEPKTCCSGSEQWSEAIERHMTLILWHTSAMVRAASVTCFAGITSSVFFSLTKEKQDFILSSVINAAKNDEVPSVRSAACRAIGVIACFPQISQSAEIFNKFVHAAEINTRDPLVSVRITSSWALANICDSLRHCIGDDLSERCYIDLNENSRLMPLLIESALRLTKDGDKIKSNAVRALGNLSRFFRCTTLSGVHEKQVDCMGLPLTTNSTEVFRSSIQSEVSQRSVSNSYQPASLGDPRWLERMVQAFLSCVTTGNVKVQWNVCHALSNLFLNETLRLQDMDWAPSVFSILLLLLRDSSNFKIRIQAASALAVPASIFDYGRSFSDVVQGLVHIIENLGSDQMSTPSSFKYRVALENQLTSTMLHVLSLALSTDHQPMKDFLVKKASFLEEWFKVLCSSLEEASTQPVADTNSIGKQKREMISKAIGSLIKVYQGRNHHTVAQRFEKLVDSIV